MKSTYGKLLRSRHRVGWAALVGAPELVHVRDRALSTVLIDLLSTIDDALVVVLLQDVTEVKRQGPPEHAAGKKKSAGSATANDAPTVTTFTVTMADGSSLRVYSACPECAGVVFSHEDVSEHSEEKRLLPCRHRAQLRAPVVF